MNQRALIVLLAVLLPRFGLGCSGSHESNRPKTHPVCGLVTHGGQAIAAATVTFHLLDGSQSAVGITDERGRYTLTTFVPGDGAIPGQYAVAIAKYDFPRPVAAADGSVADTGEDDVDAPETGQVARGEAIGSRSLLPGKYADVRTSGLKATINEGGDNQFHFTVD
ncbi:MAG: hypothetical protein HUU20_03795 [Pirellulales bacterium]|nr:hypothetical protein [Pirellulales bacterium]